MPSNRKRLNKLEYFHIIMNYQNVFKKYLLVKVHITTVHEKLNKKLRILVSYVLRENTVS